MNSAEDYRPQEGVPSAGEMRFAIVAIMKGWSDSAANTAFHEPDRQMYYARLSWLLDYVNQLNSQPMNPGNN